MKLKTFLWILNILLALAFGAFSFIVFKYCNLQGFAIFNEKGFMHQLAYSCTNSSMISYIFGGVILTICLIIIYLNRKVQVEN